MNKLLLIIIIKYYRLILVTYIIHTFTKRSKM